MKRDDLPVERAAHMKTAISKLQSVVAGRTFDDARVDDVLWPAIERYLEIISEAARKLPSDWQAAFGPEIPWRQVMDLGNRLRHGYSHVQADIVWDIVQNDLRPLEVAVDRILAAHPPTRE